MRRAFTLVEIMATVTIMTVLISMLVVYVPNYAAHTSAVVRTENIEALNSALEHYKIQGGIEYAHSLAGAHLNTTAGNAAIISALQTGFTRNDIHFRFLDNRFTLDPGSIKAIGSGTRLYFESGSPSD